MKKIIELLEEIIVLLKEIKQNTAPFSISESDFIIGGNEGGVTFCDGNGTEHKKCEHCGQYFTGIAHVCATC